VITIGTSDRLECSFHRFSFVSIYSFEERKASILAISVATSTGTNSLPRRTLVELLIGSLLTPFLSSLAEDD
jgi:hypothetical protein